MLTRTNQQNQVPFDPIALEIKLQEDIEPKLVLLPYYSSIFIWFKFGNPP